MRPQGRFTDVVILGGHPVGPAEYLSGVLREHRRGPMGPGAGGAGTGQIAMADVAVDRAGNVYAVDTFSGTSTFTSSQPNSARSDGFAVKLDQ